MKILNQATFFLRFQEKKLTSEILTWRKSDCRDYGSGCLDFALYDISKFQIRLFYLFAVCTVCFPYAYLSLTPAVVFLVPLRSLTVGSGFCCCAGLSFFFYNNDSPSGLSNGNMIEYQHEKSQRDAIFIAKQHTELHTERRRRDIVILLHVIKTSDKTSSLMFRLTFLPGQSPTASG
jgi:hypothetical protein